jgi:hypothetical protein
LCEQSRPISGDCGLTEIELLAAARDALSPNPEVGGFSRFSFRLYRALIDLYIDLKILAPLKSGGQRRQRMRRAITGCPGEISASNLSKIHHDLIWLFPTGCPTYVAGESASHG